MNQEEKQTSKLKEGLLFGRDIIVIIIIVLVMQKFIIIPFMINGQSMYSSYYDKEFIIVDRISYLVGEPHRGDVIVFKPGVDDKKEFFLKRVIGVPGDKLKIFDGKVYIQKKGSDNFIELQETYLNDTNAAKTFVNGEQTKGKEYIYEIGEGKYFVMGDNRNHSTDSRACFSNCVKRNQFITQEDMVGKVLLDLGYVNIQKLSDPFVHPDFGVDTFPKFFSSHASHDYPELK